jgi:hypothetical protein
MGGLWLLNVKSFQSMLALSHNHAQKKDTSNHYIKFITLVYVFLFEGIYVCNSAPSNQVSTCEILKKE